MIDMFAVILSNSRRSRSIIPFLSRRQSKTKKWIPRRENLNPNSWLKKATPEIEGSTGGFS